MKNSDRILIRKDKPAFQILILFLFVMLAGIVVISSSLWVWWQFVVGIILLVFGSLVITLKSEMYFDAIENSLEITWKALGLSKSQQEKLPEINYIAVVRVKTSKELNIRSISYNDEGYKCNLNLIFKDSKVRYRKLCTVEKEEAFILAKKIAEKINKSILDHTTPDKKWIE
jgi:hypothetical protein